MTFQKYNPATPKFHKIKPTKRSLSLRRSLFGVGINDADYMVCIKVDGKKATCPIYRVWANMLKRCYCEKYKEVSPTYDGCSVDEGWHKFSAFTNWVESQNYEGLELDKDIVLAGNKIYSPEMCVFIPHNINSLLNDRAGAKGKSTTGVTLKRGRYQANIRIAGSPLCLGTYDTESEAICAYHMAKVQHIEAAALTEGLDQRAVSGLHRIAKSIRVKLNFPI